MILINLGGWLVIIVKNHIKARYDKTYKITEEELLYLIKRVERLKSVTEEICQAWINQAITDDLQSYKK